MDMPSELVTVEQVKARFHRALTSDDERVVGTWILDAWDELMDYPGLNLPSRLTAREEGLAHRVARVIRAAILRRLKNPGGRRQYSYTVDDATVSETLATETLADGWFTDDELAKLAPAGWASDAFSIRTDAGVLPDRHYPPLTPPTDEWYPWTSL